MKIHFSCTECGTKYSARAEQTGKEGKCKNCGSKITVPKSQLENLVEKSHTDTQSIGNAGKEVSENCANAHLSKCPKCQNEISLAATYCPNCGRKLKDDQPDTTRRSTTKSSTMSTGMGCLVLIGIIVISWIIGSIGNDSTKTDSSNASVSKREIVYNSSWDGSVLQVERFLDNVLKDPDSFEAIEWSAVQKTDNGGFMVRCKYRAKNSFGGYVVENKVFFLDSNGNVTNYMDYPQ